MLFKPRRPLPWKKAIGLHRGHFARPALLTFPERTPFQGVFRWRLLVRKVDTLPLFSSISLGDVVECSVPARVRKPEIEEVQEISRALTPLEDAA